MKNVFNNKKFKYGSVATILTVVFVVLVIAVNFIFTALSERFPFKWDVTDLGIYSFGEETKDYLDDLNKDVQVTLISSTGENIQVNDYYQSYYYQNYGVDFNSALITAGSALKAFTEQSDKISYSVVDIDQDPAFVSKFQKEHPSETLQQGQILVQCDGKLQIVSYIDMIYIDSEMKTANGSARMALKTERMMLSAVMAVTADNVPKVLFTTGHNEASAGKLQSLLGENTYEVGTINLGTEEIPEDTTMIIINSPLADFTLGEVKKLDTFLENGGNYGKNVVFFGSVTQGDIPNLESLLKDWGILINKSAVIETNANRVYDQYGYAYYLDYADEVYGEKYQNRTTKTWTAYAIALDTAFDSVDTRSTSVILTVPETAVLMPLDLTEEEGKTWTPQTAETKGPFDAGIIGTKRRYDSNNDALESHVTAFSSSYMVSDTYLGASSFDNSSYILDVFAGLTGKEESLDILSKEISTKATAMTAGTVYAYMIVFVIVLPLLMVALGIFVWIRRRNK